VRQPRGRQRLALAAAVEIVLDRDPLDGDVALEALVPRAVDDAHPTRAQTPAQTVATEHELARGGRGGAVRLGHRLPVRRGRRRLLAF
jgi:hypothetical protein